MSVMAGNEFPGTDQLNRLLPSAACNQLGKRIRFVDSAILPGAQYEEHIYATGEVSTRVGSWHDLFNALVWTRFPLLKSAMNASHHAAMSQSSKAGRGSQRDALTLFDECGVIVAAIESEPLEALSHRDWSTAFAGGADQWNMKFRVVVAGHAMMEKFLQPYKSMTANALLVKVPERLFKQPRQELRSFLDSSLAGRLLGGRLLKTPAELSPLPMMGIPGWWHQGKQDERFYSDQQVFRPAPENFNLAPVICLV